MKLVVLIATALFSTAAFSATALDGLMVAASYKSTSTSITNNTNVTIKYSTADYDTYSAYDSSTGEFTCPSAGLYVISAAIYMNTSSTAPAVGDEYSLFIEVNGSHIAGQTKEVAESTSAIGYWALSTYGEAICNEGEVIKVIAFQNFGENLTTNNSGGRTRLSIRKL